MTGYEKYQASNRGRPSPAIEYLYACARPLTTGEFAAHLRIFVRDMGKRLLVLERKGFIVRLDKSTVVGATWRFTVPDDFPPQKDQEPVRFLGSDCLSAMRQVSAKLKQRGRV